MQRTVYCLCPSESSSFIGWQRVFFLFCSGWCIIFCTRKSKKTVKFCNKKNKPLKSDSELYLNIPIKLHFKYCVFEDVMSSLKETDQLLHHYSHFLNNAIIIFKTKIANFEIEQNSCRDPRVIRSNSVHLCLSAKLKRRSVSVPAN